MPLYYKEYGDQHAPLMVFIHGGGVSGWMWDKQIQYFTHFHCIVPDLPQQGKSSQDTTFTIHDSASKILELIEEKGEGKRVIVIGFSLGAQILLAMLSLNPHAIDDAMINSALVRPIPFSKLLTRSMVMALPLIKNKTFSDIQAKSMYIRGDYLETYYQENRLLRPDVFARISEENMAFRIPENFRNAGSRMLVTVGEKERKVMKESLIDILRGNSNCKGIIFPEVGHGISLAKPDFFNQLVEKWVLEGEIPDEVQEVI